MALPSVHAAPFWLKSFTEIVVCATAEVGRDRTNAIIRSAFKTLTTVVPNVCLRVAFITILLGCSRCFARRFEPPAHFEQVLFQHVAAGARLPCRLAQFGSVVAGNDED